MLRKTKLLLLIGSIILIVVIVIVLVSRSLGTTKKSENTPILSNPTTSTTSTLTQPNLDTATKTKQIILPQLPIEINSFETSVGINTDILISSFKNDDPDVVRVEVFGLDYLPNQNDPATNPNMVAFKESFEKAIAVLQEKGVSIKDLHIQLSNRQFIRDIAEGWINALHLLP